MVIGAGATVGMSAVVTKSVSAGAVMVGRQPGTGPAEKGNGMNKWPEKLKSLLPSETGNRGRVDVAMQLQKRRQNMILAGGKGKAFR